MEFNYTWTMWHLHEYWSCNVVFEFYQIQTMTWTNHMSQYMTKNTWHICEDYNYTNMIEFYLSRVPWMSTYVTINVISMNIRMNVMILIWTAKGSLCLFIDVRILPLLRSRCKNQSWHVVKKIKYLTIICIIVVFIF